MMVPHGVRRTGSHEDRPVTMVVALEPGGWDRSTRWTEGVEVSSSQTNRCVGFSSLGQNAIWSADDATELDTRDTSKPGATTMAWRLSGPSYGPSALAERGWWKPNNCSAWASSWCLTNVPKSPFGLCAVTRDAIAASPTPASRTEQRTYFECIESSSHGCAKCAPSRAIVPDPRDNHATSVATR